MRSLKALLAVGVLLAGFAPALAADDSDDTNFKWNWYGSLRARPEYNDNLNDLSTAVDDEISYTNYRVDFGFNVDLDKDVSVVIAGQWYGYWGDTSAYIPIVTGGPGPIFIDSSSSLSLYTAYIQAKNIFGHPFSVRAGRQPLEYADEWLLGNADFYRGTYWDALRGDWEFSNDLGSLSAFWAKGAEVDYPETVGLFGGDVGGDFDLYGLWSSWNTSDNTSLDVSGIYWLDRRDFFGEGYSDKRFTGAVNFTYIPGDQDGLYFVGNAALQRGRTIDTMFTKQEIEAEAFELTPGWMWEHDGRITKLWARVAHYSGDDTSTHEVETFNPLTQDQHARYGMLDFWGGTFGHGAYEGGTPGLEAFQIGFSTETKAGIKLMGMAQTLRRAEKISPGQDNRNLGQEIGVAAGYDYGKNLSLELGVGQLFAGTAFSYEPPLFSQSNARRVWLSATARF